jgi:hypothetical protein
MKRKKNVYFIYDARYNSFDEHTRDRATVFEVCDTLSEARDSIKENYPSDSVIVPEEIEAD